VRIIENYFDPILLKLLHEHILSEPLSYGEASNKGDETKFFSLNFSFKDNLTKYLCMKVAETLGGKVEFLRVYANIQFRNMHGSFHSDDGDHTVLVMISDTLDKEDGCFVMRDRSVDFVKNRCIIFNAKEDHMGLASTREEKPRITLAFKTRKLNGNN